MNKMIKGSVAGAAGVALLMGSFGTYALWNDAATMPGNTITSGVMDIEAGAVSWDDAAPGAWNPATDLVVPGDEIVRTQTFTVTGTGKNLKGTIKLTGGDVTQGGFNNLLDVTVKVTSDNATVVQDNGTNDFTFNAPFDAATLTAVVTYEFDKSDVTEAQEAQDATAAIADSTLTIQQTR
jgi:alternate signal-mediated exported protein